MNLTSIVITAFVVIETLNVLILYFAPGSNKGNGLGAFKAFEKSKEIPEVHQLVKYLVYWVAGSKLIFIALLILIALKGDYELQHWTLLALIISILSFFWRLFPMIKKMDAEGHIQPKGYSRTLGFMITLMLLAFSLAWIFSRV